MRGIDKPSQIKILFLDVDGVLNSWSQPSGPYTVSRTKLRLLREIVLATDCKIVLSSTWRKFDDTRKVLRRKMAYKGLSFVDKTPVLNGPRGLEIQHWLDTHFHDRFVILDDNSDMLDSQLPFFVQTNGDIGLTKEDVKKAIQILNGDG